MIIILKEVQVFYFINGDIEFDTELVSKLTIDAEHGEKLTSFAIHKKPKD